jgi:hypothetical protein
MPWDEKKKLVQVQMEYELADKIDALAKQDERSRNAEVVWLLRQGIQRREMMFRYADSEEENDLMVAEPRKDYKTGTNDK